MAREIANPFHRCAVRATTDPTYLANRPGRYQRAQAPDTGIRRSVLLHRSRTAAKWGRWADA